MLLGVLILIAALMGMWGLPLTGALRGVYLEHRRKASGAPTSRNDFVIPSPRGRREKGLRAEKSSHRNAAGGGLLDMDRASEVSGPRPKLAIWVNLAKDDRFIAAIDRFLVKRPANTVRYQVLRDA